MGEERKKLKQNAENPTSVKVKEVEKPVKQLTKVKSPTLENKEIRYNPKADIHELKEQLAELKNILHKSRTEKTAENKIEKKIQRIEKAKPPPVIREVVIEEPKNVRKSIFQFANW